MAMEKPTLREQIIHDLFYLPTDQLKIIDKMIEDYKISQIPYEDEELSEEEKKALKQYDSGKMKFEDVIIRREV